MKTSLIIISMTNGLGIVLTGGGARASYQVGALRAMTEIFQEEKLSVNLDYLTGTSAGAINATYIAAKAENFDHATKGLINLWKGLSPDRVYKTNTLSLGTIGAKWITGSLFGGLTQKGAKINYLLNNAPLRKLLHSEIDMEKVEANCRNGILKGVALTATNYYSGASVVFYDGEDSIIPWSRSNRFGIKSKLGVEHILGSSSIPFFFPPTRIDESYYGDGCVRQTTPLSPAIHLGAKKIIAIGIRHMRPNEKAIEYSFRPQEDTPGLAQIVGVALNAVFLDSLESDVERVLRINQTLKQLPKDHPELRVVPVFMLRPSRDLGLLAGQLVRELPATLKYLLKGIGVTEEDGSDLISYLAFDTSFTTPLIELGYEDTFKRKQELLQFITEE